MRIAVMQPYLFPYIGYFQLIHAVDTFILLDDVAYINKGWVNRNRIIVNEKEYLFTLPLKEASQNKLIKDIEISADEKWKEKFLKTIQASYKKAPCFQEVFPMISDIINDPEKNISTFIFKSILHINEYLKINTKIIETSGKYKNGHLKAQEKIADICIQEKATEYINPVGGSEMYSKDLFKKNGIELKFILSNPIKYTQYNNEFIPWLSIIDVLMFNHTNSIKRFISSFELI